MATWTIGGISHIRLNLKFFSVIFEKKIFKKFFFFVKHFPVFFKKVQKLYFFPFKWEPGQQGSRAAGQQGSRAEWQNGRNA
jgi:hypothetical protein